MPGSGLLPLLPLDSPWKVALKRVDVLSIQWRQWRSSDKMDEKKDLPVKAIRCSSKLLYLFFEMIIDKYCCLYFGIYLQVAGWVVVKFRKQEHCPCAQECWPCLWLWEVSLNWVCLLKTEPKCRRMLWEQNLCGQTAWVQILILSLTSFMTMSMLLNTFSSVSI